MDPQTIQKVFSKSADELLTYRDGENRPAENIIGVSSYEPNGDRNLLLALDQGIDDTISLYMYVPGLGMNLMKPTVTYPFYDRGTKTLCARFESEPLFREIVREGLEVELHVDLRFLIERARDYYTEYGDMIRYPDFAPAFSQEEMVFPKGFAPSTQQMDAVRTILNSKLSYVWGAPGTGKTQMVLATAVMAYMRRRERITIIAPTNNSVEQVLRGILKVIESDPEFGNLIDPAKDISRVGSATEAFIEDYPQLCEPIAIASLISKRRKEINLLMDVLDERMMDRVAGHIKSLEVLVSERGKPGDRIAKRENENRISMIWEELRITLGENRICADVFENTDDTNMDYQLGVLKNRLFKRDRPKNAIP